MSTTVSVRASKWNSTTPYFQMAGRPCRSEAIDQLSGPPRAAYTCSRDDPILSEPKAPARRNSRIETLTLRGGTLITRDQPDANSHWAMLPCAGRFRRYPGFGALRNLQLGKRGLSAGAQRRADLFYLN